MKLETYRELRMFLMRLPVDHPLLDQPIQAVLPVTNPHEPQYLLPVREITPIRDLELDLTRASYDRTGEHEPEDWVFRLEYNPHRLMSSSEELLLEPLAAG